MAVTTDKHWRNGLLIGALLAVVAAAVFLHEPEPDHRSLDGYLYFGGGSFLGRFDLRDGTGSIVVNLSDVNIRYVSDYGDRQILLTVSGPVNNQIVSRMLRYDVDTGRQRTLFAGRKARYVPGDGHFVFHAGRRLLITSARANAYSETEIDRRDEGDTPVVVMSNDKILFTRERDNGEIIIMLDLYTGEENELNSLSSICSLHEAVWMADRGELFCRATASAGFVITRLDASAARPVELGAENNAVPLTYLQGQDAIIMQRRADEMLGGSRSEVWVHDLRDASTWRLSADQVLGDSVAYKRY